ncbi:MAG TPA: hypothetical protein VK851_15555 [Anaerolineales bacterium]|nr:hypothetical protein [Anaerolineales bacterium]
MNLGIRHFLSSFGLIAVLVGCSSPPPADPVSTATKPFMTDTVEPTTTISPTPDPCSPELIEAEVQKVHNHMREFDDAAILASNLPMQELSAPIANLQRIRREAEDESVPSCLTDLKNYQITHMNSVIGTLVAFLGGADEATLAQNITTARDQHDQYTLELARLLGLPVVTATAISTPSETPSP